MAFDQSLQALFVVPRHISGRIDPVVISRTLFLLHFLEIDHALVAKPVECLFLVEHVSDTTRHTGSEIPPGTAKHHNDATRHIFATVVAAAFDNGYGARVPNGKTFARDAAEIALTRNCAVKDGVPDNISLRA